MPGTQVTITTAPTLLAFTHKDSKCFETTPVTFETWPIAKSFVFGVI